MALIVRSTLLTTGTVLAVLYSAGCVHLNSTDRYTARPSGLHLWDFKIYSTLRERLKCSFARIQASTLQVRYFLPVLVVHLYCGISTSTSTRTEYCAVLVQYKYGTSSQLLSEVWNLLAHRPSYPNSPTAYSTNHYALVLGILYKYSKHAEHTLLVLNTEYWVRYAVRIPTVRVYLYDTKRVYYLYRTEYRGQRQAGHQRVKKTERLAGEKCVAFRSSFRPFVLQSFLLTTLRRSVHK